MIMLEEDKKEMTELINKLLDERENRISDAEKKKQIMNIRSAEERQRAILENMSLFIK